MNPSKTPKFITIRGRKPIFKLTSRRRSHILNLFRSNDQKNHISRIVQVTNPEIDIAVEPRICMSSVSDFHCSFDQIFHVREQDSEFLSSVNAISDVESCSSVDLQRNISPTFDENDFNARTQNDIFKEHLATAFVQGNLTHVQGNIILKTLRSLPYLSYLPKDSRTLLNTPRQGPIISKIDFGEYLHIGFAKALDRILQRTPPNFIPDVIQVNWNTDGARLNNSGNIQIWPIQCSIANIVNSKPEIVGIYKGIKKPRDINVFLQEFIDDVLEAINNGGVLFLQKKIPIQLRAFIADAPARSWILNHFGHTSSNPCSKCRVVGTRCEDQMVFMGINHRLRTDDEYSKLDDEDHHKGPSPLSRLSMGMVSQVPFEYMHLIGIGLSKKCISAWVTGKYGKKMKLSGRSQDVISKRLRHISRYCPREFARKPRALNDYKDYKATEGRQFILYTAPVAVQGILEKQGYRHFLLLHAAIRALCHSPISQTLLVFAKLALEKFVEKCPQFYKDTFLSYNVHALLHLAKDAEHLGPLDSFSAFAYENNIRFFRKYYRKPHRPLQQFFYRQFEKEKQEKLKPLVDNNILKVFQRHNEGPLPFRFHGFQYKKLKTTSMFINVDSLSNRCCILHDLSVCIIHNIFEMDNIYYLVIKKFEIVEDFYDVGIPSSLIGVFKCSALSNNFNVVSLNEVKAKCYLMPCWTITDDEDSDPNIIEADEFIIEKYIVSVLL